MSIAFLYSLFTKGIGAVLEVVLQIVITRTLGVGGYGTYSTWINVADLVFWVLFSGLVKCNTFYLSDQRSSIRKFKQKYYLRYVLPVLFALVIVAMILGNSIVWVLVLSITGLQLFVLDQSSTLLARGRVTVSLIGEYVLGRIILLLGVVALWIADKLSFHHLLILYVFQYICVLLFYPVKRNKEICYIDNSSTVSLKKWAAFQRADIVQAMISQMPVLLQFCYSGSFDAGVVSIVLLVKKLVNFISGPSAKVFLPEFSRLYRAGEKENLRKCFASIMRMQMLFLGPLAVVLIGFPGVILKMFAEELLKYVNYFVICAVVFLIAASLGPCGGFMQMTGQEKKDNMYRELAVLAMLGVMVALSKNRMFVLYGLCVQTMIEAVGKYLYVFNWMGKSPATIKTYILGWIPSAIAVVLAKLLQLQTFYAMIVFAGCVCAIVFAVELHSEDSALRGLLEWRKK